MKIGNVDINTVNGRLDVLDACFRSPMWKELPEQEKIRLVGRLSHILEIAERRDLER